MIDIRINKNIILINNMTKLIQNNINIYYHIFTIGIRIDIPSGLLSMMLFAAKGLCNFPPFSPLLN